MPGHSRKPQTGTSGERGITPKVTGTQEEAAPEGGRDDQPVWRGTGGLSSSRQGEQLRLEGHALIILLQRRETDRSPTRPHIPQPQSAPIHVADHRTHLVQDRGTAVVMPPHDLREVPMQVLHVDLVEDPLQHPLQLGLEGLDGVGGISIVVHILTDAVVYRDTGTTGELVVSGMLVGDHQDPG